MNNPTNKKEDKFSSFENSTFILIKYLVTCQTIQNYTEHIWRLTNQYNVLQPREWKERVSDVMLDYQLEVIDNVRSGYVGNLPGKKGTKPADLSCPEMLRQMS